ncbi:alpha/beta fold hydrolase [Rhodopirellula sp. MGV]|uniref:alpha/beta fold hydrolase n=1 Tax=Rhodopirellula sp. MGV TaxID=2023130 RepID=UPI000B969085|nr:alpha/beta fold hydrolase [Rhodopirellula sp. MGV]OYP36833.1 alpha/beta hydrolase [Rhodopirellula sp. MGV]PNY36460.1 alpha/beta hydrolase [Rhodopirellula baltica]
MQQLTHQFDVPVSRFTVGNHSLAYRDQGSQSPGSGGRTILCVHGNPTWSYYYRNVFHRFAGRYRVVAVDHIGCGESDKPPRGAFSYQLADHQQNLADLIEHLDLKNVMLLAHDWGGAIGLGALLKCRERFSAITLLNTGAFPPPYVPWRIAACRIPVLGTLGVRGLNLFARAAITMAMDRNHLSPEVTAGLLKPYDSWKNRVAIDAFVRDIPMKPSDPTYQTLLDLENALPSLAHLPSLLVWGMKDWCFRPECLRRFEKAWPNARSVEIADAGHYVIEDAPLEVLDAIETFLSDQTRNSAS